MNAEPQTPEDVLAAIRAPFLEAGGERVDPPILQPLGLLLDLAGEALRERLFVVQADGGEEACLRPDFTVALARLHLALNAAEGRYVYEGRAFRAAGGGSHGFDEFLQLGLEIHLASDPDPVSRDAEMAAIAWRAASAGGRDDLRLIWGDAGLFGDFLERLSLDSVSVQHLKRLAARPRRLAAELAGPDEVEAADPSRLSTLLAAAPEGHAASALREIWALAGIEPVGGRSADEIAHRLVSRAERATRSRLSEAQVDAIKAYLAIDDAPALAMERIEGLAGTGGRLAQRLRDWRRRLDQLARGGVPEDRMRLVTAAGRSFDYYDGPRFEVLSGALGEGRPVAAGGRYDTLLARLGGQANAAVGGMVRPWRAYRGGEA